MTKSANNQAQKTASWLYEEYGQFYQEFLFNIDRAKNAFITKDFKQSILASANRLSLYSKSIAYVSSRLQSDFPELNTDISLWEEVETLYLQHIQHEYAEDVGRAYIHSVRRKTYQDEWRGEDNALSGAISSSSRSIDAITKQFEVKTAFDDDLMIKLLSIDELSEHYADKNYDAALTAERVRENISRSAKRNFRITQVDLINAGFYRNRGAYLVGRLIFEDGSFLPLIIALLNDENGIYVDAVLTSETYAHNLFSSTLANFHVTTSYYHEVCAFLKLIMPKRPLGLHYSTIGYNHLGKVAVMNELEAELTESVRGLETAVGEQGTVAMGFAAENSAYNLKVIRNKPTRSYKWGEFGGVESVIRKYTRVHEINRTGSMLDSIIYYKVRLDKSWFAPELLTELLDQASETVTLKGDDVIFSYLIVQIKLTPLPVFLESATDKQAETAISNLGYCIKNNASANIFNRDLDARNYGIGSFSKVYLFDYDALEDLTDVKIRTNLDREDGEEDIPDWYFEDGVIFLPEELVSGLCIRQRAMADFFSRRHSALLRTDYWSTVQAALQNGSVPSISVYPDSEKLR